MECIVKENKNTFRYKAKVTAMSNNHMLLHKDPNDNRYKLLSSTVEVMETSRDAIIRELEKKLGISVKPEALTLKVVVENFYSFQLTQNQNHELSLIYLLDIDQAFLELESVDEDAVFGWFPIEELDEERVAAEYLGISPSVFMEEGVKHLIINGK